MSTHKLIESDCPCFRSDREAPREHRADTLNCQINCLADLGLFWQGLELQDILRVLLGGAMQRLLHEVVLREQEAVLLKNAARGHIPHVEGSLQRQESTVDRMLDERLNHMGRVSLSPVLRHD